MAANGAQIPCRLDMTWVLTELKWSYRLVVGGIHVPAAWTRAKGNAACHPPMIFSGAPVSEAVETPQVSAFVAASDQNQDVIAPESLPQGVSYDKETMSFQANIKDSKTKRYVFLGEFASVDAAHQKYLKALSRYAPDKQLAPALVA